MALQKHSDTKYPRYLRFSGTRCCNLSQHHKHTGFQLRPSNISDKTKPRKRHLESLSCTAYLSKCHPDVSSTFTTLQLELPQNGISCEQNVGYSRTPHPKLAASEATYSFKVCYRQCCEAAGITPT
ncbi:unnamed protein product [Ixodes pacificus]